MFADRKRIILDSGPSWPDYKSAEPFVVRYYPFFRRRPNWFPLNIRMYIKAKIFVSGTKTCMHAVGPHVRKFLQSNLNLLLHE